MLIIAPRISTKIEMGPINQCIYCFYIGNELTNEHIIALGLAGIIILLKSSCKSCAKITSRFEGIILKHAWKAHRSKYKYPTRRTNDRIKEVKIHPIKNLTVGIEEYPAPMFTYMCTTAGILLGVDPGNNNAKNWEIISIVDFNEMNSFYEKFGKEVKYEFYDFHLEFAQMLAKIAYSYAVAFFGINTFEPLVLELILKGVGSPGYLVGGNLGIKPSIPNGGHIMGIEIRVIDLNVALLIVNIRLMSSVPGPDYHVVVGKLSNKQAIDRLLSIAQNHKGFIAK